MKKRLLITSIVMMLVVAVALGTSTYAWFTSSNAVTANSINLYAAINSDSALEISYTNTESTSNWLTAIDATTPTVGEAPDTTDYKFNPAAPIITASPATLVKHDSTHTGTYFSALDWKTDKIINSKFKGDPTGGERYVWTDGTHNDFYLHNGSTANPISNINITATIEGAAQSFIRIAVFKNDGSNANDGDGNFELYGILSNGVLFEKADPDAWTNETQYYTSTAQDATGTTYATKAELETALASNMIYTKSVNTNVAVATQAFDANDLYTNVITNQSGICTTSIALGGLGVNDKAAGGADEMRLKVVVWMDGSALNDDTAGTTSKVSSISLNFAVGAAA